MEQTKEDGILEAVINEFSPNLIYLDSGDFSSNIEFSILNKSVKRNTILVVRAIFFPKSIRSFLIFSFLMFDTGWEVLWVDRTTPQRVIVATKK